MGLQTTLKRSVVVEGIGLHSGRPARLTIKPALPNQGIHFVRTDLQDSPLIAAHYKNVVNTQMATTLGHGRITISTVEHVLAALQGMGIDNALIEVDGPEVPILDGSSLAFCQEIEAAGVAIQPQARPYLALRRRVEVRVNEKWAIAEPSNKLMIHSTIDWDHPAIGYQEYTYTEGKNSFAELASARTFGFLRDVEALKRMGLARGGSLDNAVVLDEARVINPNGLRFADEFVRHKVLDALGDLKLAGIALCAHVRLHRSGHELHSQLLAEIFKDPNNFEIVDESSREERRVARIRAALAGGVAAVVG